MARPGRARDCGLGVVLVKRALLIAFQFPPMSGTSGIQRTLRFAQHLGQSGWEPIVLSAHPRAYPMVSDDQVSDIPADVPVARAFALDTARHMAIKGRYSTSLALPDRWISWWLGAIPTGLALIRKYRPAALWSTYPIATAHVIGMTLSRLTGIPWIADFRDSMTEEGYPRDPRVRKWFLRIERAAIRTCAKASFTAPGAIRMYARRYPDIPLDKFALIENGYDESSFADLQPASAPVAATHKLTLVHSGVIYPTERDPRHFFAALGALRREGRISAADLRVVLRAPGHDDYLHGLITDCSLADIVQIAPAIPYREALAEMMAADGLLLLQGADCNHQIPAKAYEYLRAGRPILGLADPAGDTAGVLRNAGIDTVAPLESEAAIREQMVRFLGMLRSGNAPLASGPVVRAHSREKRSALLGQLFDEVVQTHRSGLRRSLV